jgi:protein-S-isoprenylcysteine O-methyltransferase Ste14
MVAPKPQNAGVHFPPPLVFVIPFFLSFLLDRRLPFLIVGEDPPEAMSMAGLVLLVTGLGLMQWAVVRFVLAKTNLLPFKPATRLVAVPPFTFTRNPMYLGGTIAYFGGALVTNWAWPLLFLPAVLAITAGYSVPREERYLLATFGAAYGDYCARVRRWL